MIDNIELEAELVQLRGVEGEVEGELDVLRRDRDRLYEECKPLRGLEGHVEALKNAKSSLEVENQELHHNVLVLQKEIKDGKLECEERLREFGQMKMDLVALRSERDELLITNTHLTTRLEEEEKLLGDMRNEHDSLNDRAEKAEDEYRKLKWRVTQAGIGNILPMSQQSAAQEVGRRRLLSETSAENMSLKNKVESLSEELHRSRLDILATRNRNLSFNKSQSTVGSECGAEDTHIETNWGWGWGGTDGQSSLSPRLNMNRQLDALRKEKDTLSATCGELRSLLREADVQRGRADAERESLKEKIEQQVSQLQNIEQKDGRLVEMQEQLNGAVKRDHESICNELRLRIRELEGLLDAASDRSEGLQSRLLEFEVLTKEQNNKTPSKDVEKLVLRAEELEKRSVGLQQELSYQNMKCGVSLNRVKELERLLEMADERNAKLETNLRSQATEIREQHERKLQTLLNGTLCECTPAASIEYEILLAEEKDGRRGSVLEAELVAFGKSLAVLGNLKGKLRSVLQKGRLMLVSIHGLLSHAVDNDHPGRICGGNGTGTDGAVEKVDNNWSFTRMMSFSDSSIYSNNADPMRREMACYMHGLMLDSGNKNPDGDDASSSSCSSSHLFSISTSDIEASFGKSKAHTRSTTVLEPSPMGMNDHHHLVHIRDIEADCCLSVPQPDSGTLSLEDELDLQWSIMQDTVQRVVKERSELVGRLTEVHTEVRRVEISAVQTKDKLEAANAEVSKWKLSSKSYAKEASLAVKEIDLLKHEIGILSRNLEVVGTEKKALSTALEMGKAKLMQEANKKLTSELEKERKKLLNQEEFQHAEVLKRCEVAESQASEAKIEVEKLHVEIQISDAKLSVLNKEKNSLKEALRRAVAAADMQQYNQSTNLSSSSPTTEAMKLSYDDGSIPQLIREMGQNLRRAKEEAEEAQFALKTNATRESEVLDHVQMLASGLDEDRRAMEKRLSESEDRCEAMVSEIATLQESILKREKELERSTMEVQVLRQNKRDLNTTLDNTLNDIKELKKRLEEAQISTKDAQAVIETVQAETECLRAEVALEISKRLDHVKSSDKAKDMINQELEDTRGYYTRLLQDMKLLREEETEARTRAAEVSCALLVHERERLESVVSDRDNLLKEIHVAELASKRQDAIIAELTEKLKDALGGLMTVCSSSSLYHPSGSTSSLLFPNLEIKLPESSQKGLTTEPSIIDNVNVFEDDAESAAFASTCATLSIKGLEGGEVLDESNGHDHHFLTGIEQQHQPLPFGLKQPDTVLMSMQLPHMFDDDESGDKTDRNVDASEKNISGDLNAGSPCVVATVMKTPLITLCGELTSVTQQIVFASKRARRLVGWCEGEVLRLREDCECSSHEVIVLRSQLDDMFRELEVVKDAAKEANGSRLELQILAEQWEDLNMDREKMVNDAVSESLAVQAQRDEARCDIRKLQSVVYELEAKVESQRAELVDSNRELASAKSVAVKVTAALNKEESDVVVVASHLKESSTQLAAEKIEEAEILSFKLLAAENEAKNTREELRVLQQMQQMPAAELTEVSKHRNELLNNIVSLEKMLIDAQEALSEARGRVMFYEGQDEIQHAELESCRKQAGNLQAVLAASKEAEALAAAGRDDARLQVKQLQREIFVSTTQWKALSTAIMEGNKMVHSSSGSVVGINGNLYQPEDLVAHVHEALQKVSEYHDRAACLEEELVDVLARAEHAEFRTQTLISEAEERAGLEIEVQKLKEHNSTIEAELVETNKRLVVALLTLGEMEDAHVVVAKRDGQMEEAIDRLGASSIPFTLKGNRLLTEHADGNSGQFEKEIVTDKDFSNKENNGTSSTITYNKSDKLMHSLSTNLGCLPSVPSSAALLDTTMYVSVTLTSLLDFKHRVEAVTLSMKTFETELLDEGICSSGSVTSEEDGLHFQNAQVGGGPTTSGTCVPSPSLSWSQQQSAIEVITSLSESEELLVFALMQGVSCLESAAACQSSHLMDIMSELFTLRRKDETEFLKYDEATKLNSEPQSQAESLETYAEALKLQLTGFQVKCSDLGTAIEEKGAKIAELDVEKQTMIVALAEKNAVLERERVHVEQIDEALTVCENMITLLEVDKEALEGCVKVEKERSEELETAFKYVKAELENKFARVEELEDAVSYGADEMLTSIMDVKEMIKAKHVELDTMTESKKKAENLASESEEVARLAQEEVEAMRAELEFVTESKKKAENLASESEEVACLAQEEVEAIRVESESKNVVVMELTADVEQLLKLLNDEDKHSGAYIATKENELKELRSAHEITLLDMKKYETLVAVVQEERDTTLEDARETTMQLKNREDELIELKSVINRDKEALRLTRKELEDLEGKHEQVSLLLMQNAEAKEKEISDVKTGLDAVSNDARQYREQARALECELEGIQSAQSQRHFAVMEEAKISKAEVRNLKERIQGLLSKERDSRAQLKDMEDMVLQSNYAFQGAKTKLIDAEARLEKYRCRLHESERRATAGGNEVERVKKDARILGLSYEKELTEANEALENKQNCLNDAQEVSNKGEEIDRLKGELMSLRLVNQAVLAESAEGEEKERSYLKDIEEKARLEVEGMKKDMGSLRLSYETKLVESNERLEKEQSDLKDAQERSKAAGVEIEGLKENLRMLQFSHEAKLAESVEQLQTERCTLKDTEERLAETILSVNKLKEVCGGLQSSCSKVSVRVSESENARLEAVEQRLKSEADLVKVEEQYKECSKRCGQLSGEMEELSRLQELYRRLTELVNTTGLGKSLKGYGYCLCEDATVTSVESSSLSSIERTISVLEALCKAHNANREVRPDPELHLVLCCFSSLLCFFAVHMSCVPSPSPYSVSCIL